jgi:5'-deoxynucleotidase YfbR-like HD superfamily hydrolase
MHTWPLVNEYLVGQHTWGLLANLLRMYPEASKTLIVHAVFHDSGELISGDSPAPLLRADPNVARAFETIQNTFVRAHIGKLPDLTPTEKLLLEIADRLELIEFCCLEKSMGNGRVAAVYATGRLYATEALDQLKRINRRVHEEVFGYVINKLEGAAGYFRS